MFSVISSQSAIIFWNSSNDMLRDARGAARVSAGSRTAPTPRLKLRAGGVQGTAAGVSHLPSFVFAYFPRTVLT